MNALLIHANNLNPNLDNKFPGDKVAFDYSHSIQRSNFILDRFLHEELSKVFKNKEYQVIVIPYTLSQQNYLELTGLRVAAHIRTTEEFNHQYVPIVFVGPETPEEIARLSDLGNILFTSGIFSTVHQESDFLKKFFDRIMREKSKITESEHQKGIERLQLSPPANYQSHHSIDNELALQRWSKYLKCDDKIPEVKEKLQTGLYFKYHRVLNPLNSSGTGSTYLISGKGKVLLVDDEAEKGWADFYSYFFQNNVNNKSIEFEALALDFKSLIQQDIIEAARRKVEQFDADVVLLDLRLCDMDFDAAPQPKPKDLTGYKILEEIKKINKGNQVIITTASNKVWNYQSTYEIGANGYIVKRHDSDVAEDIKNLKNTIQSAVERADYLKVTWSLTYSLKDSLDRAIRDKKLDNRFGRELILILDSSFNLYDNASTPNDFAYAYLSLFKCLELVTNELTFQEDGTWMIIGPEHLKHFRFDEDTFTYQEISSASFKNNLPSIFEKITGLCFQLWNYEQIEVQKLYYSIRRRNEFIHPSENKLPTTLKSECDKIFMPDGYSVLLNQISTFGNKITLCGYSGAC
ncbi:hypothetical protein GCM10007049_31270 [Echinicola pacifica]|uniref:Response regulator receiver domain-containing protein n=1 Tax=Echinicola pacifica TaxID=346377 RepID=A0A918UVC3_9BACT|nr:response regulator [Echinicola pacifica]GGZ35771.1 hypothetical protein GCM10007049_31270 [Echinicola pacifica]